jgi:hypothetical protein
VLPGLLGGGGLLIVGILGLLLRRSVPRSSAPAAVSGIISLYDQETRQALTTVITEQEWLLYRHPLRLVVEPANEADSPLARLVMTRAGLVLEDDDGVTAQPLLPGSIGTLARGRVQVQYQA